MEIPEAALPHQRDAIQRIVTTMQGRALLAFGMGLGKTLVACACVKHYKGNALFIVPASKIHDWQRELKKWTNLESQIISKGSDTIQCPNVIGSYAMIRSHVAILKHPWTSIVCDESHQLKEPESLQTRRILPVLKRCDHVLLLSGTPQLSRPYELYTQLSAVCDDFGTFRDFTLRYCNGHDAYWGYDYRGVSNTDELRERMAPIMIRENDSLLDLPAMQRKLIGLNASVEDAAIITERMTRLKALQLAAQKKKTEHDKKKAEIEIMDCWRDIGRVKIPYVLEWLKKNLGKEKMAVFTHHMHMMDAFGDALKELGVPYLRIDGSVKVEKRQALLDPFRATGDTTYQVALLSLTACGAGMLLGVVS